MRNLKELGSRQAWLRIKAIDDSACIHRLYSLEGAILGIKNGELDAETKADLKDFYNSFVKWHLVFTEFKKRQRYRVDSRYPLFFIVIP